MITVPVTNAWVAEPHWLEEDKPLMMGLLASMSFYTYGLS
jgi:hypothetical protein